MKNIKFSLQVGQEKLQFYLAQAMASPILEDAHCQVNILEKAVIEDATIPSALLGLLEAYLTLAGMGRLHIKLKEVKPILRSYILPH